MCLAFRLCFLLPLCSLPPASRETPCDSPTNLCRRPVGVCVCVSLQPPISGTCILPSLCTLAHASGNKRQGRREKKGREGKERREKEDHLLTCWRVIPGSQASLFFSSFCWRKQLALHHPCVCVHAACMSIVCLPFLPSSSRFLRPNVFPAKS